VGAVDSRDAADMAAEGCVKQTGCES
jgi:hypothetical protein